MATVQARPLRWARSPFYFNSAAHIIRIGRDRATTLGEFADGLQRVSLHSIHFHFIEARVRLKLNSNDFSLWLEEEMDLGSLADRLNRIDIYTSTLQDVRRKILKIVESAV